MAVGTKATDPLANGPSGLDAPADDGFTVTPDDVNELATVTRGLWVGGAGDVNLITRRGTTIKLSAVPAGTLLPVRARQVLATGTTATLIVGLV